MGLDFPAIYLLSHGFERDQDELHQLETKMKHGGHLVWNIKEADLVVGKIVNPGRAAHELRKLGVHTENVTASARIEVDDLSVEELEPPKKKQKIVEDRTSEREVIVLDESTASESESGKQGPRPNIQPGHRVALKAQSTESRTVPPETVKVLTLAWYEDSVQEGTILPMKGYLVYEGKIIKPAILYKPAAKPTILPVKKVEAKARRTTPALSQTSTNSRYERGSQRRSHNHSQPPLLHQTTTEHDVDVPPLPAALRMKYSCQRPTRLLGPNEGFIAQLRIIRKARKIKQDPIGELSYNKGISTIAAYPHTLTSIKEIQGLPFLSDKFALMWQTWKETGKIKEVEEIEQDEDLKVLSVFFEIYDVGEKTANEFFKRGWRDLDDVIENWSSLTRNQQIGVKYYDEFLLRMDRTEVENISQIILDHANKIRAGFQMVICGSYRRGKPTIGDVDVVMSHPDEEATMYFLRDLLAGLEDEEGDGYITHELVFSMANSERNQNPLKWRGTGPRSGKAGFDTLDHAFCVWQDPEWSTKQADRARDPNFKNPNPHRRVDIIISPWKTAGCAVIGWSGAIMFERDLRKYCRAVKGYKFDSSGVRSVADGNWIDLEGFAEGFDGDMLAKEKRVFEQLGLEWREPTERCTD